MDWSPLRRSKRKCMHTIGNHKIATIYDDKLRPRGREILSDVKWKTIDVVRLGYEEEPSSPIILITVNINDVNEDISQGAVDKIHELMVEFGLPDVHAEIKTGRLFEQAGNKQENYDQNIHYPLELCRVPKLGVGISSDGSNRVGSLCLFLKINGSNYAMTCQHVATSSGMCTQTDAKNAIFQPAKQDLEQRKYLLNKWMRINQSYCDAIEAKKSKSTEAGSTSISKGQIRVSELQDEIKELVPRKSAIKSMISEAHFGTLEYAPGIAKHATTNARRDWAVIRLSDDRFETLPPNILPCTHFFDRERHMVWDLCIEQEYGYDLLYGEPGLTAPLPLEELNATLGGLRASKEQDYESPRVFKHGRTSGWTIGALNEIRSGCRFGDGCETTEYCVVNIPTLNYFSYQGDSGACILDTNCNIVGMLHSGNGENVPYGAEITYFTPMEWIIQDIKDSFKTEDVVIERHIQEAL
ncbi:hypothetical protein V492_05388 [Pseudogymnoascus sp. VKM F-4246]|nr:hypothetical protein V492_05388 [Pseudogymnoascus sp. VKM F-4246]